MNYKTFYFIALITSVIGCRSETEDKKTLESKDSSQTTEALASAETVVIVPWTVVLNPESQAMEIRKNETSDLENVSPQQILDAINTKYPQTKLEWDRLAGNKAFVKIADATHLTQSSGSLGARAYLAEVTYNLTEFPEIKAVNFSFEEGDHASPGVYTRADFDNLN